MVKLLKNLPASAGDARDLGLIPGSGRSPGGVHGHPLQYSCLENPMDGEARPATVHGVAKSSYTHTCEAADFTFLHPKCKTRCSPPPPHPVHTPAHPLASPCQLPLCPPPPDSYLEISSMLRAQLGKKLRGVWDVTLQNLLQPAEGRGGREEG